MWIDPQTKEKLKKKQQELRDKRFAPSFATPKKYTLDLNTCQMIEERPSNDAAYELYQEPEIGMSNTQNYDAITETNTNIDFLSVMGSNYYF